MVMFKISKSPELEHVLSPKLEYFLTPCAKSATLLDTHQPQLLALGCTSLMAGEASSRFFNCQRTKDVTKKQTSASWYTYPSEKYDLVNEDDSSQVNGNSFQKR